MKQCPYCHCAMNDNEIQCRVCGYNLQYKQFNYAYLQQRQSNQQYSPQQYSPQQYSPQQYNPQQYDPQQTYRQQYPQQNISQGYANNNNTSYNYNAANTNGASNNIPALNETGFIDSEPKSHKLRNTLLAVATVFAAIILLSYIGNLMSPGDHAASPNNNGKTAAGDAIKTNIKTVPSELQSGAVYDITLDEFITKYNYLLKSTLFMWVDEPSEDQLQFFGLDRKDCIVMDDTDVSGGHFTTYTWEFRTTDKNKLVVLHVSTDDNEKINIIITSSYTEDINDEGVRLFRTLLQVTSYSVIFYDGEADDLDSLNICLNDLLHKKGILANTVISNVYYKNTLFSIITNSDSLLYIWTASSDKFAESIASSGSEKGFMEFVPLSERSFPELFPEPAPIEEYPELENASGNYPLERRYPITFDEYLDRLNYTLYNEVVSHSDEVSDGTYYTSFVYFMRNDFGVSDDDSFSEGGKKYEFILYDPYMLILHCSLKVYTDRDDNVAYISTSIDGSQDMLSDEEQLSNTLMRVYAIISVCSLNRQELLQRLSDIANQASNYLSADSTATSINYYDVEYKFGCYFDDSGSKIYAAPDNPYPDSYILSFLDTEMPPEQLKELPHMDFYAEPEKYPTLTFLGNIGDSGSIELRYDGYDIFDPYDSSDIVSRNFTLYYDDTIDGVKRYYSDEDNMNKYYWYVFDDHILYGDSYLYFTILT